MGTIGSLNPFIESASFGGSLNIIISKKTKKITKKKYEAIGFLLFLLTLSRI